eukprot:SAG31_NODE_12564_length_932_cov_1.133253_2_plen_99_part_01
MLMFRLRKVKGKSQRRQHAAYQWPAGVPELAIQLLIGDVTVEDTVEDTAEGKIQANIFISPTDTRKECGAFWLRPLKCSKKISFDVQTSKITAIELDV